MGGGHIGKKDTDSPKPQKTSYNVSSSSINPTIIKREISEKPKGVGENKEGGNPLMNKEEAQKKSIDSFKASKVTEEKKEKPAEVSADKFSSSTEDKKE